MHFPNEKIIFELPIYSMSKEEFKRRWDNWEKKTYEESVLMENPAEKAKEIVKEIIKTWYPQNVWKYNQIIGYVEIAISYRDIVFNISKTMDTRIHAVGKTKHYIQDIMVNGMHFSIDNMTNAEIVIRIDEYLDSIEHKLTKPLYLYRNTYDNVKNHIDFNELV